MSFAYVSPEPWAALWYLEEDGFERQIATFTRILNQSGAADGDAKVPYAL